MKRHIKTAVMNRSHYSEIKNLAQLRLERLRIRDRVSTTEENIEWDMMEISEIFTFEGIINTLFPRTADTAGSVFNAAYSAYDLIMSVVGLLSSKKKSRRSRC